LAPSTQIQLQTPVKSVYVVNMTSPRSLRSAAFTLIELLTVVAIIVVLMGLTIGIAGFARDKGARARAQSEIAALESSLERFKIDQGGYPASKFDPDDPTPSGNYETRTEPDAVAAKLRGGSSVAGDLRDSSLQLYYALSGYDPDEDDFINKTYFNFSPNMLDGTTGDDFDPSDVTGIVDPWGNPYGYYLPSSNPAASAPISKNPTFDLYSTANSDRKATDLSTDEEVQETWVTNW